MEPLIPIFDAHLDLAWNALSFNRDLSLPLEELQQAETHATDGSFRGRCVASLPEFQQSGVRVCIATLLVRSGQRRPEIFPVLRKDLEYASCPIARAHAIGQLAYYQWLADSGDVRLVRTARELQDHWAEGSSAPLGIILSFEGCDPILDPDDAYFWYGEGVRAAGLTHYGIGQYAHGTGHEGPLMPQAADLLQAFEELGIVLDVTHLSDQSMAQVLEDFTGPVLASHHNCRALVPGQRQLSDEQIRLLIDRDAVIGTALDAWMLYAGWQRGQTHRSVVSLAAAADHIDHICSLAGNARHCAIGSDLDGGFGSDQTPLGLDRYRDIQKLSGILRNRGYTAAEVHGIFHGNLRRLFTRCLR
ncbi:MAG: membrane dipeptidase [Bacteroidota bacterium]|nr:membrane dipeptidase [Bacteroidota bacterium]